MADYYVHIVTEHQDDALAELHMRAIPAVGDGLRLGDMSLWRVTYRVWQLNEAREDGAQRVNIGVQWP
ncbi:MAG: hypothetical protein GAK28_03178 [Luteibacter sp.]|uniref:hypothetical protein n=1 Tax=Luteibacter sp. TaxID=1886636 RepID=UPI0013805302|nr:hypothetical protein [Luteibacter sp.]KAF1005426.1 MAG: hypothetical protein GAK28_03178 [Luteibacter sp.]